jgi:hypothetical protein
VLDPKRVALQGLTVPLTAIAMAVQGLIAELQAGILTPVKPPDSAGSWAKKRAERIAKAQRERLAQRHREDDELMALVMAAVELI